MPSFLVKTNEMVEGTYRVTADTPEQARQMVEGPPIDWDNVTQLDYMAYETNVTNISPEGADV